MGFITNGLNRSYKYVATRAWEVSWLLVILGGLAPIAWFRQGLIIKGVDSYFSVHPGSMMLSGVFVWDARVSPGQFVVNQLFIPFQVLQGVLVKLGCPVFFEEMIVVLIFSMASVVGMFVFARLILGQNGQNASGLYASVFVAIAWVTNWFSLDFVWWHQLYIEETWAVLPWLMVFLWKALSGCPLRTWMPHLGLLVILGAGGLTEPYLPGIAGLLIGESAAYMLGTGDWRSYKQGLIWLGTVTVAVSWWLVPSLLHLSQLYSGSLIGASAEADFRYASGFSSIWNVLSLTAVPALHQTVYGTPYVSWSWMNSLFPFDFLKYLLPACAMVGSIVVVADSQLKRGWWAFTAILLLGILVSKGLNWPWPGLNQWLTTLPYGAAFRHPNDKFSFLVVPPMVLLAGLAIRYLLFNVRLRWIGLVVSAVVCMVLGYPWWTGAVIPNGGGLLPSARVEIPPAYQTVGDLLKSAPIGGKIMVLPYSANGQSAFAWKHGIQPNMDPLLQDWNPQVTLVSRVSGQMYSDRVGTTIDDGILAGDNKATFALARLWGIDRWLVHNDWAGMYSPEPVSPAIADGFLTPLPKLHVLNEGRRRNLQLRAKVPKGVVVYAKVVQAPKTNKVILRFGKWRLQDNAVYPRNPHHFYFALYGGSARTWDPGLPLEAGLWYRVKINVGKTTDFSVNGVKEGVPLRDKTRTHLIGISVQPASASHVLIGVSKADTPAKSSHVVIYRSKYLTVWTQKALPLIYAANHVLAVPKKYSAQRMLGLASQTAGFSRPAVMFRAGSIKISPKASARWDRSSPTHYRGTIQAHGTSLLVFDQSYSPDWRLAIRGGNGEVLRHVVVNGFGNGWMIRAEGRVSWNIQYEPQIIFDWGLVMGAFELMIIGFWFTRHLWARHRRIRV